MYVIKSNRNTNSYTVRKINHVTQVVRVGRRGLQGETGPEGPKGDKGDKGDTGTTDYLELQNLPDLTLKADKADTYTKTEVDNKDLAVATTAQSNLTAHTSNTNNPHSVTKAQVGLSNVPNTDFTAEVSANTAARHTHSNKATLDATTASFTTAQETKLSGIATGATANATDAQLRDRSTHTGTQAQSTITNLTTDLAAKANAYDTVNLTGDQTVAGVKTFSSSPVVPTATTNTQAVNKAQMDTADATKVSKAGDTMTGTLTSQIVVPSADNTYDFGSPTNYYRYGYTNKLFLNSTATLDGSTAGQLSATGNMVITPTVATDQPVFSAEFLPATGWTSTNWTGDFVTGWTHTVGNTTALSQSKAAVINTMYQITYTVTGRTAGSFTLAFGGQSQSITATGSFGPKATTVAGLVITPTSDFNGTIVVSIKSLTAGSTAAFVLKDSGGANRIEMRGTGATYNTFIGDDSGMYNTTGSSNSAMGNSSLSSNTTGSSNSAIGANSLRSNTTGYSNSAIGRDSLYSNTTGYSNSAIGQSSLFSNTTGSNNSAIGYASLYLNTTGSNNSAIGYVSLYSNTTGSNNSAIGANSLRSNTTGYSNLAIGRDSLYSNTTGIYNSAIGNSSLYSNTTGSNNSAIGYVSLYSNTTGSNNSAIGQSSGRWVANGSTANAAGNNSVFLGVNTKAQADAQTNQIVIGYNAIGNGSNTVTIGNSSVTGNFFSGNIESTTVSGGVILKSPDGTRYKLTIANGGTVTVSAA